MIVVIADDLSGAAELAGVAVRHGLSAEVQTAFAPESIADVVCVDTDTRLWPAFPAAHRVSTAARTIAAARPEWIFKKCDSVLRGPVLAEARAVADAFGAPRILLVPANPSRDRTIRNGQYHVEGHLLHETSFARDPGHPRLVSDVKQLLGDDLTGVTVPDVQSLADVAKEARQIDSSTLPVGAADFFAALLEACVPARPMTKSSAEPGPRGATLLVCGSAASWSQRRSEAVAHNIPVFELPHDLPAILRALHADRSALVGIGDGPETHGFTRAALANELAQTVVRLRYNARIQRLLLEGGATAASVIAALGWKRLQAEATPEFGIGVLRPLAKIAPLVIIKPGSYAWPPPIWPAGQA